MKMIHINILPKLFGIKPIIFQGFILERPK